MPFSTQMFRFSLPISAHYLLHSILSSVLSLAVGMRRGSHWAPSWDTLVSPAITFLSVSISLSLSLSPSLSLFLSVRLCVSVCLSFCLSDSLSLCFDCLLSQFFLPPYCGIFPFLMLSSRHLAVIMVAVHASVLYKRLCSLSWSRLLRLCSFLPCALSCPYPLFVFTRPILCSVLLGGIGVYLAQQQAVALMTGVPILQASGLVEAVSSVSSLLP